MSKRTVRRLLAVALAAAWFALGFLSDSVPWFSEWVWILLCSMAAGSALSLAQHTSMFALKRYTFIVAVIGSIRTVAYGHDGNWGPGVVWAIVTLTTVAAALALIAQAWVAENDGGDGSG